MLVEFNWVLHVFPNMMIQPVAELVAARGSR
jgi:hypothetical protein